MLWQIWDIKSISIKMSIFLMMSDNSHSIEITPEMQKYIRARSTDLRVATTCEGPLIFSIKVSPPKATDLVVVVGERKVYISSLQAQYIKVIDERMLPRCALERAALNCDSRQATASAPSWNLRDEISRSSPRDPSQPG